MTPKQADDIQSKQTALTVRPTPRQSLPEGVQRYLAAHDAFPDYQPAENKAAQYVDITGSPGSMFAPSASPMPLLAPPAIQPVAHGAGLPAIPPVIGAAGMTPFQPIGGALAASESAAEVAAPAAAAALPTAGLAGLAGLGFGLGMQALAGARSPQGSIQDFLPARSGGGQDAAGQAVNQMLQSVLNKLAGLNSRAGGP